jgi:antibiotic biosynthesis monooxygenase (ABM) superfamily enzyme
MPDGSPILSVIVRKFRDADKEVANDVLTRFEKALETSPGFLGVRHNHPSNENDGTFSTVISFRSLDDLIAWEQSELRKEIVEELSQYIEGEVVKNRLWDIDSLLVRPDPPRKWKAVFVLTFWVLLVGACLDWIADSISPDFPSGYARFVFLLVINILLNSYFFLPRSMAILHRIEDKFQTE